MHEVPGMLPDLHGHLLVLRVGDPWGTPWAKDLLGYVLPDHPGSPSPDLLGGPGGLAERSSRISGRSCWTDRELLEDLLGALGFGRHKSGIRAF